MHLNQMDKLIPISHIIIAIGAVLIGLFVTSVTTQAAQSPVSYKPGNSTFTLSIGDYNR